MGRLWTLELVWWCRSTCWTADQHNAHQMQASLPLASGAADAVSTGSSYGRSYQPVTRATVTSDTPSLGVYGTFRKRYVNAPSTIAPLGVLAHKQCPIDARHVLGVYGTFRIRPAIAGCLRSGGNDRSPYVSCRSPDAGAPFSGVAIGRCLIWRHRPHARSWFLQYPPREARRQRKFLSDAKAMRAI